MIRTERGNVRLYLASLPLLLLLVLPVFALVWASSPTDLLVGIRDPLFGPALWLSAWTSLLSLGILLVFGTPLAWALARRSSSGSRVVEVMIDLPIVMPPAVIGVALLYTFGRSGLFATPLSMLGVHIPFTAIAVVLAQVVVSSPFYVQSAVAAFRRVDPELLLVARTLGRSPFRTVVTVAVPLALPGLLGGAALAWARALGEFGATLLFAGNLPGVTQTMPLAIYMALESDVRVALALALVLAGVAVCLLCLLRGVPVMLRRRA